MRVLYSLILILLTIHAWSQVTIQQRTYGGPEFEDAQQIIESSDGNYIVVGSTGSSGTGNTDFLLMKIDMNLNCIFYRAYGETGTEKGMSVIETSPGEFILCGYTNSTGNGGYDVNLIKVDVNGDVVWNKTFGGQDWDFGNRIVSMGSGVFAVVGETYSFGAGSRDGLFIKIDANGELISESTFGGQGEDYFKSAESIDGFGVVIVGATTQFSDNGNFVFWSIAISNEGEIIWERHFDQDIESFGKNVSASSGSLLFTGYLQDVGRKPMFMKTDLNGVEEYIIIDDLNFDYSLNDGVLLEEGCVVGGIQSAYGFGGQEFLVQQRNNQGDWMVGLTFGTVDDEELTDIMLDSQSNLLFLGSGMGGSDLQSQQIFLVQWPNDSLQFDYTINIDQGSCEIQLISEIQEYPLSESWIYLNNQFKLPTRMIGGTIQMFDGSGKLVYSQVLSNDTQIPVERLMTGIYFLSVVKERDIFNSKIFIR